MLQEEQTAVGLAQGCLMLYPVYVNVAAKDIAKCFETAILKMDGRGHEAGSQSRAFVETECTFAATLAASCHFKIIQIQPGSRSGAIFVPYAAVSCVPLTTFAMGMKGTKGYRRVNKSTDSEAVNNWGIYISTFLNDLWAVAGDLTIGSKDRSELLERLAVLKPKCVHFMQFLAHSFPSPWHALATIDHRTGTRCTSTRYSYTMPNTMENSGS
jgi:hypothetical protein